MNRMIYIIIWPMFLVWWIEDKIDVEFKNMDKIFTILWIIMLAYAFMIIASPLIVAVDRLIWCSQGLYNIFGCN